ncbi:MAG TPA: MBL fold metallo-hydrolase [Actinomycetota bacterium]|nr:MBL fold metallo-hydrolase [Actinomycetota bacterium]
MLERLTWFRQASFLWRDTERTIYIDPWGTPDDAPPADVIVITHAHQDHFCIEDIERLSTRSTKLAAPHDVAKELSGDVTPVAPGESHEIGGLRLTTVPAYNTREEALDFHPRANRWVGYVLELNGRTFYHAGDTDHAAELDDIKSDVALVPIGGYYTMNPEEAASLVRAMQPALAVPMHYGFVVGQASDAGRFREAADPVPVEELTPTLPFERL